MLFAQRTCFQTHSSNLRLIPKSAATTLEATRASLDTIGEPRTPREGALRTDRERKAWTEEP
jgi:hypothetical protein